MELHFLLSADHLIMVCICTKFCQNILNDLSVREGTQFQYYILQKDINPQILHVELQFWFSEHCLIMAYILILIITKGHNSVFIARGYTVLVLLTLSDHGLHLYQVFLKIYYTV